MVETLDEALNVLGQQFVDSLRYELNAKRINASGGLSRSVSYEVVDINGNPAIWLNYDDYGDAVDSGRSPSKRGGPKQNWRDKIEGWMKIRGISPRQGMTFEQTAFLITRNINKKGYKPKPWVQPALDRVLNQDFTELFGEALANEIITILNK
jgi:hypothetical protein